MVGGIWRIYFLVVCGLSLWVYAGGEWVFDGGWCWCNPSRESCSLQHTGCESHCVSNPWGVGCHPEPGNLASSKPADQSGTHESHYASLAVDGNNSTSLSDCITTHWMKNPWWRVDLKGLYVVYKVYILNTDRTDKCKRLKDFDIRIGNKTTLSENTLCKHHGETPVACSAWIELTCDNSVLGRYVGIQFTGDYDSQISVCEVIVKGYEYPYNVAYSKPASQVDTLSPFSAKRAVDGITGEDYPADPMHSRSNEGRPETCTHTSSDNKPWWEVDLQQDYKVYSVQLVNRLHVPDGGKRRLTNFYIRVGDDSNPSSNPVCVYHGTEIFDSKEFTCSPGPMVGRYVSVQLDSSIPGVNWGASKLSLCEVMVKGYKDSGEPFLNVAPTKDTRTDTSVTIRWTPWTSGSGQGQGSVQSYTVQYRQSGESSWTDMTGIWFDTTSKEVTGLQKDNSYEFRVVIVNGDDGQSGDASPTVEIKTCGDPLIANAPTLEQRFSLTETFISIKTKVDVIVTWESSLEAVHKCESPVRYRVKYKKADDDDYSENGVVQGYQSGLQDLIPYTDYTVAVSVINSASLEGPAALKTFQTMEGVPPKMGKPVITNPTLNSLTLNWQRPNPPHGVIIGYQYQYLKDGGSHNETQNVASNNQQSQMKVLDKLENNVLYKIKIRAKTSEGYGEWSETAEAMTVGAPSKPGNVMVTSRTNSSLAVSWTKPTETHGDLVRYEIQYNETQPKVNITEKINGDIKTSAIIMGLKAATEYSIKVRGVNNLTVGAWSDTVKNKTDDGFPEKPVSLSNTSITAFNITVSWQPPAITNGDMVKYEVQYWSAGDTSRAQSTEVNKNENQELGTTTVIEKLTPYTKYTIQVRAYTSAGAGGWSDELEIITLESVPTPPQQLIWTERTTKSIKFKWQEPTDKNGKILHYTIECKQLSRVENQTTTSLTALISGLTPGTKYTCRVKAKTSVGYGEWSQPIDAYPDSGNKLQRLSESDVVMEKGKITFTLPKKDNILPSGEVKNPVYKVIVEKGTVNKRRRRRAARDPLDAGMYDETQISYIAAVLKEQQLGKSFTVGDGKEYGRYKNEPLEEDSIYSVYFGLEAQVNGVDYRSSSKLIDGVQMPKAVTGSPGMDDDMPMVAGIVSACVAVIIIAVIIAIIYHIRHKRQRKQRDVTRESATFTKNKKGNDEVDDDDVRIGFSNPGFDPTPPPRKTKYENIQNEAIYDNLRTAEDTKVEDFLELMKSKTRALQKKEYDDFPSDHISVTEAGQIPENYLKNRYKNILPYDNNRVKLEAIPNIPNSDYINASFVDAYNRPSAFIASQGPKDNTVSEFWRMIWENNVSIIVMVTHLFELGRSKCTQYWPEPDDGTHAFGEITAELLDEEVFSDYVIRRLLVTKHGTSKTVTQFHFTSWPDHGAPKHATSLLGFRKKIKSYITEETWPVVVHCSAGVGRTGTYIALDYLLDQAKAEGKFNIPGHIFHMRSQRTKMIQTVDQYYFLHDALLEALQCGDTAIQSHEFRQEYEKLKQKSAQSQKTKLQEQFEVLQMVCPTLDKKSCQEAMSKENINKNRVKNIVPESVSRPYLKTIPESSSEYINAVYVNGFRQRDAYIITQMPLPHTMADFWCLVYDMDVRTIVMMEEPDPEDKTCAIYWPNESICQQYGPILVTVTNEKHFSNQYTCRNITLTHETNNTPVKVRQFQLHNWPSEAAVPTDKETILQLLEEVRKWQQQHENSKIVVQCINGAHHSGLYCAVSRVLEKMQVEQEIDVFQVVKAIRINRPQLVDTVEQYQFCYDIVQQYLDSMDTYANFK